jgi:lysophospholipase L1-like esterase
MLGLVLLVTLLLTAGTAVATGSSTLSPGARYVAIGSSYAAGFGIRPLEPGSGACGRSEVDYPHLVAAKLRLQLDDVSCGGAVTANALDTPQGSTRPQIDAVTPQTRLVTLTIGGNDVNYVGTAIPPGPMRRSRRSPTRSLN